MTRGSQNEAFRISLKTRTVLGVQLSNELIGLTLAKFYYHDVITSFPSPVIGSSRVPHVITPSRRDNMLTRRAIVSFQRYVRIPTVNEFSPCVCLIGIGLRSSIPPFSNMFHSFWKRTLSSPQSSSGKRGSFCHQESYSYHPLLSTRGESAKYQVEQLIKVSPPIISFGGETF